MGDSCYTVAENLAKLSLAVIWKSKCLSDNLIIYTAKESSRKLAENDNYCFFFS